MKLVNYPWDTNYKTHTCLTCAETTGKRLRSVLRPSPRLGPRPSPQAADDINKREEGRECVHRQHRLLDD
ncbi:hypothetical protein O3P69_011240 [Scylla paramamosain]|uniref:Uncharacterized protein n=1 Tax=Scylla paramamosain TaxID=85552 RepID=A0AAW0STM4_SCYPA